ncbi:MAG: hypothetical protein ACK5XN_22470, partial [Bacteroidota bacterium]
MPGVLYKKRDLIPPIGLLSYNKNLLPYSEEQLREMVASGNADQIYTEVMTKAMRAAAADMILDEYRARMENGEQLTPHDITLMDSRLAAALSHGEDVFAPEKMNKEDRSTIELAFKKFSSEFGIDSAHANTLWDNIGGFMGLGAVFLAVKYRTVVKKVYAFATKAPIHRVAFYTILKLLAGAVQKGNDESIATIQTQIDMLQGQLDLIRTGYSGGKSVLAEKGHGAGQPKESTFNTKKTKYGSGPRKSCMSFGPNGPALGACPQKNSKKLFEVKMDRSFNSVDGMNTAVNAMTGITTALTNGDIDSAEVENLDRDLKAASNKLDLRRQAMQNELDTLHADKDKSGKKSSPVERMVRDFMNAANLGQGQMASFGGFSPSGDLKVGDDSEGPTTPTGEGVGSAPVVPLADGKGGGSDAAADEFAIPTMDQATPEAVADTVVGKEEQSLEEFEDSAAEINADSSQNIFDLLSRRYLLSYPKILNKVEPAKEIESQPASETPENTEANETQPSI